MAATLLTTAETEAGHYLDGYANEFDRTPSEDGRAGVGEWEFSAKLTWMAYLVDQFGRVAVEAERASLDAVWARVFWA